MTGVRTYRPAFKVTLAKNVIRRDGISSRQTGNQQDGWGYGSKFDLTPYLGDGSEISIVKSVHQPCGSVVITVPDQPIVPETGKTAADTLYGLAEPMDGLEICLARSPQEYGGTPPIYMIALIRDVSRREVMGQDGRPRRVTVVQAQDYGCVFATIIRIIYKLMDVTGQNIADDFKYVLAFGTSEITKPIADYIQLFVDMANRFLNRIFEERGGWTWDIELQSTVTKGRVPGEAIKGFQGPIWDAMMRGVDSPWNEMFVEDRDSGPWLVLRPTPFKTYQPGGGALTGTYIEQMGQTVAAETVDVSDRDIQSLNCRRSDENVANFFFVTNPFCHLKETHAYMLDEMLHAKGEPWVDAEHENNDPKLYGDRMMTQEFCTLPDEVSDHDPGNAKREEYRKDNETNHPSFYKQKVTWLRDANRDNVCLEDGTMTVKGDERIRAGRYIRVKRGRFEWECYATQVTQTFAPYRAFVTTIGFTRGTCFWSRITSEQSPYLLEGKRGVYS